MTGTDPHVDEYGDEMVAFLELIWGKGFMAPGGAGNVARMVAGLETRDRHVLDIGCGIGGGDIILARDHGARITGIDIEAPLIARARDHVDAAGLSDRIEIRHVTPGKLDFPDASFDIVYSAGAFTQIEDKAGMFAECLRVLRPGGAMTTYDWMGTGQPYSATMQEWFRLEGLTYNLGSLASHRQWLAEAGFVDVSVVDDGGWYAAEARRELALLQGPLEEQVRALIGDETHAHYVRDWELLVQILESRELVPGYLRGVKPAA